MKDMPVLLGFDPKKVVGHMSIYDGEFLQLLLNATPTASPAFSFGWQVNYSSLTIGAVSLNLRPAEPKLPEITNDIDSAISRILNNAASIFERNGNILLSEIEDLLIDELSNAE